MSGNFQRTLSVGVQRNIYVENYVTTVCTTTVYSATTIVKYSSYVTGDLNNLDFSIAQVLVTDTLLSVI